MSSTGYVRDPQRLANKNSIKFRECNSGQKFYFMLCITDHENQNRMKHHIWQPAKILFSIYLAAKNALVAFLQTTLHTTPFPSNPYFFYIMKKSNTSPSEETKEKLYFPSIHLTSCMHTIKFYCLTPGKNLIKSHHFHTVI